MSAAANDVHRPVKRKRFTYTIPSPLVEPQVLSLPPENYARHFDPRPLLFSASTGDRVTARRLQPEQKSLEGSDAHRQHCLGISSLCLDTSTIVLPPTDQAARNDDELSDAVIDSEHRPAGILYSAGRDGLIASWQIGLPMQQRSRRSGTTLRAVRARKERLTELGAIRDDDLDNSEGHSEGSPSTSDTESHPKESHHAAGSFNLRNRRQRRRSGTVDIPYEEKWQVDHAQLNALKAEKLASSFRQSVQPHTDWINDIKLCNMNRTLISASSDHSIRAWTPHDPKASLQPTLLGTHGDYVKCLAYTRNANWIASGGFDRKIRVWDLQESRPQPTVDIPSTSETASIYTIATNPKGTLLASGSPERIVRLWDIRSKDPAVARLSGHADNIRSLLISDDGQIILSASADSTIKLWSTNMQRCLHTFTYHNESVWSLYSNHPYLESFYSGDRSGLVCKVNLEDCGDMSDGECLVLCKDDDDSNSEGINSIVAVDDAFVWTATGSSSISRWNDVMPRSQRAVPAAQSAFRNPLSALLGTSFSQTPLLTTDEGDEVPDNFLHSPPRDIERKGVSFAPSLDDLDIGNTPLQQPDAPTTGSVLAASHQHIRRPSSIKQPSFPTSMTATKSDLYSTETHIDGLPLESLVCFALDIAYNSPFSAQTVMQRQQYAESLASLASGPSRMPQTPVSGNSFGLTRLNSRSLIEGKEDVVSGPLPSKAMLEYAQRDSAADAVPLRMAPDHVIRGRRGLVRSEQLNDRRTVLTADTAGDISAWDIIACQCLGTFSRSEINDLYIAKRSQDKPNRSRTGRDVKEVLEQVRGRVEGEGTTTAWATIDVRSGALAVHLEESRCFAAEIYTDDAELEAETPFDGLRFNPGKVVLRNLFDKFLQVATQRTAPTGAVVGTKSVDGYGQRMQRSSAPGHIAIPEQQLHEALDASILTAHRKGSLTAGIALATPAVTLAVPPSGDDLSKRVTEMSLSASLSEAGNISRPGTPGSQADHNAPGDYFTGSQQPESSSPVAANKSSTSKFMGKLKTLGRTRKGSAADSTESEPSGPALKPSQDSSWPADVLFHLRKAKELQAKSVQSTRHEAPLLSVFPSNLVYSVADQDRGSEAWSIIFRARTATTDKDEQQILAFSPIWILQYLLTNEVPKHDPLKITFVLSAWVDPQSDSTEKPLPEMPESHTRLTANRILRISKVSAFVVDKLSCFHQTAVPLPDIQRNISHTSLSSYTSNPSGTSTLHPAYMNRSPEDIVELICNNIVLPPRSTLAAVRQFCFKKGGDLLLSYRLKSPATF